MSRRNGATGGKAKYIVGIAALVIVLAAALIGVSRWEAKSATAAPTEAVSAAPDNGEIAETAAPATADEQSATQTPTGADSAENTGNDSTATPVPTVDEAAAQQIVADCRAELEALAAELESRASALYNYYRDLWRALPEDERTEDRKIDIGAELLDEGYALEGEVDSRVNAILDDCRKALSAIGADTSPCDDMYREYLDRKAAAVDYYSGL